ncbi:MAG: ABC transporter permease [Myxococcaceae bacterium]
MTYFLRLAGVPMILLWRTLKVLPRQRPRVHDCLVQLNEQGSRSFALVFSGLAFFGVVMVSIAYAQARKYTGNITIVGPAYFELLVRELGPLTAALLAAARAAAGTSAEIAAMSVNEQVEALELSASDPLAELLAPRIVASAIAVPCLTCIGTVAATMAAVFTVSFVFGADGRAFMDTRYLGFNDVLCAATKAVICGLFIPLAAAARGFKAKSGAAAVGEAVTSGVVDACMGVLFLDFTVAIAFRAVGA